MCIHVQHVFFSYLLTVRHISWFYSLLLWVMLKWTWWCRCFSDMWISNPSRVYIPQGEIAVSTNSMFSFHLSTHHLVTNYKFQQFEEIELFVTICTRLENLVDLYGNSKYSIFKSAGLYSNAHLPLPLAYLHLLCCLPACIPAGLWLRSQ